jgi:hypothetical protein
VTALSDGNYVISSPLWDSFAGLDVGAVTWVDGTSFASGNIGAANSLIGTTSQDQVGGGGVRALSSGHYVVCSSLWDGDNSDVGAVTWVSGGAGISDQVSAANSLVGAAKSETVCSGGVIALANGNYVVLSPGVNAGAGAVTWANGSAALVDTVSATNSLVGNTGGDAIGSGGATAFSDSNYAVDSPLWDNVAALDAGAVSLGRAGLAVSGPIASNNSVQGTAAGGGASMVFGYDATRAQLAVGRPASNLVTLFTLPPNLVFSDGFEVPPI